MCGQRRERKRERMCVYVKLSKATKINKKVVLITFIFILKGMEYLLSLYSTQNTLWLSVNTLYLVSIRIL